MIYTIKLISLKSIICTNEASHDSHMFDGNSIYYKMPMEGKPMLEKVV